MNRIPKILFLVWFVSVLSSLYFFIKVNKANKPLISGDYLKLGENKYSLFNQKNECFGLITYELKKEEDSTLLLTLNLNINLFFKRELKLKAKSFLAFNSFLQLGSSSFGLSIDSYNLSGRTLGINNIDFRVNLKNNNQSIYEKNLALSGPIELKEFKDGHYQLKQFSFSILNLDNSSFLNNLVKIKPYDKTCSSGNLKISEEVFNKDFNFLNWNIF